jgi:hypothetical protein
MLVAGLLARELGELEHDLRVVAVPALPHETCGTLPPRGLPAGCIMADAAILIGCNEPKSGREMMAAGLFGESMQYYNTLVKDGTIESFEPVMLSRHGGEFDGFILIRGEAAKLDQLQRSQQFQNMTIRAVHCLDRFGIVRAYIGEGLQRIMQEWMTTLPK